MNAKKQTAAVFQADAEKAAIISGDDVSWMNEHAPTVNERGKKVILRKKKEEMETNIH